MTKGITLTRNGYGNWFIKNTDYNDTSENSAAWVKSVCCAENIAETTDDK